MHTHSLSLLLNGTILILKEQNISYGTILILMERNITYVACAQAAAEQVLLPAVT